MLNPRNLRSSGCATALFASLTLSRSFWVRNRLTEVITRSPARRLRTSIIAVVPRQHKSGDPVGPAPEIVEHKILN